MKLAYVTPFDAKTLNSSLNWSGTSYYIAEALKKQSLHLEYLGPLQEELSLKILLKCKSRYYKLFNRQYAKNPEPLVLKNFAKQVAEKSSSVKADIIFSGTCVNPIAYLECSQPIAFWSDATFANLVDFYPEFTNLCQESIKHGHLMENLGLQKSQLAIYSSEWAAQTAIDYYQADPNKVKVVPFGANVDSNLNIDEIKDLIASRPTNQCKLLFMGLDWFRKGGNIALEVAEQLNNSGLNTELTIVGCQPITEKPLPIFVKSLGYISKSTPGGKNTIYQLIANSHFLILPALADCTPIVFCEANSLGVPCISRKIGGISTVIKDDLNGRLFAQDNNIKNYCDYIYNLFINYSQYRKLALSAFHEYESRLNWKASGRKIKDLLTTII
jgi:glycosyltransferase involved in cell wall biosynthesis